MTVTRGGRLSAGLAEPMQALNTSVHIDRELWREDIRGSIAHARALARAGLVADGEAAELIRGLREVGGEIEAGTFTWDPAQEDVHMNIEARLTALLGPVGAKLHAGRSRNDQVATDLRLYTRRRVAEVLHAVIALANTIVARASQCVEVLMPLYTHLQRAQPSRFSHHLMCWQELLERDAERLWDARCRLNECPLGAGAGAGSGFPLDRAEVARELGFERPMRNSLDATASRDFLIEVVSALAVLGIHLSRIGEEIVLWSSREFGFVTLSDEFSTSSSMMPQKKNPDVAELIRGKAARLMGELTALLALEKNLAFGYGRDLQEDKQPVFHAFEHALVSCRALDGAIATMSVHQERTEAALAAGHLCATDLADYLAASGVPFREAHHVVGGLVRLAEAQGIELAALPDAALGGAHPALATAAARRVLDPRGAVERRSLPGGPAKQRVLEAIVEAEQRWRKFEAQVNACSSAEESSG